ncbi:MAG: VWA domain-containing protein [Anaerolineaceae bacterium]|nr:VWA domain-containing protein [Anaerolineaceae bacterium]
MNEKNHYNVMNIPRDANQDMIKRSYQRLAKKYHPDSNPFIKTLDQFFIVQEAYRVLSDSNERNMYDVSSNVNAIEYPQLKLNKHTSWNVLKMSNDPQIIDVLLEMDPGEVSGKVSTKRFNLALLVDTSTSMAGSRLDAVKRILGGLLESLDKNDVISLVVFNDRARILIPAKRVYEVGDISTAISGLEAGGGTEMFAGLSAGIDEILKNKVDEYLHQVILLTDGHTYGDEEKCIELAYLAANNDIGITTLGMGSEWDEHFLDKIASYSGDTSQYISDGEALHTFIESKLKRMSNHEVENVTLENLGSKATNLIFAMQLSPLVKMLDIKNMDNLGHLSSGDTLRVLLEYEVHPIKKPVDSVLLDTLILNAEIPSCDIRARSFVEEIQVPNVDEKSMPTLNRYVYQYVEKAVLFRMEERANLDIKKGNIANGTKTLQNIAKKIGEMGVSQLSEFIQSEALQLGVKGKYTEEAEKKIRYGTRELCLLPGKLETP